MHSLDSRTAYADSDVSAGQRADAAAAETRFRIGIDAGSITVKYTVIDASGSLVTSGYQHVEGDFLQTAQSMLKRALQAVAPDEQGRRIAHATITGYGEDVLRKAFGFDSSIVLTAAHLRAARAPITAQQRGFGRAHRP